MGIYEKIKNNKIHLNLHGGFDKDTNIYFDITEAISHSKELLQGISETETDIVSNENLLDYFAVQRIKAFQEILPSIDDEKNKATLCELCGKAEELLKKFAIGDIIKYINSNYENIIIKKEEHDFFSDCRKMFFPLVEFCIQYQSGISNDVFMCLAANREIVYIIYYDKLKKKLLSSQELFDTVFSKTNMNDFIRSRCEQLLLIAKNINDSDSSCEKHKNVLNDSIFLCTVAIMKKAQDRDTITYGDSVRRIRRYFSEIEYDQEKLTEFENTHTDFNDKLDAWMKKNGSVFSQEIPSDIAEKIFETDAEWITKLLLMTHTLKEGGLKSQFAIAPNDGFSIIDFVSHNIDTDEYFSYSRQQEIQIAASVGTSLIMQIFTNETYLYELTDWMAASLGIICTHCKFQSEGINNDFAAIIHSMQFVDAIRKKSAEDYSWSTIYGSCMLIIASIEKILRLIYKYENKIVLSDDLIQLGGLLNNSTIETILTEDLMKSIGFYLSKYGYIGLNYRNRLAHLSGIYIDEINSTLPYTLFYMYLCIVNGVFIYYCTDSDK